MPSPKVPQPHVEKNTTDDLAVIRNNKISVEKLAFHDSYGNCCLIKN